MKTETSASGGTLQRVGAGVLLLAAVTGGVLALLYFMKEPTDR